MDTRLNFRYEDLLKLSEEFRAGLEGRMRWGDTLFLTLGRDENKCLVVWTPKETSEREHLPGFYTDDGKFFMKVRSKPGAWITYADLGKIRRQIEADLSASNAVSPAKRQASVTSQADQNHKRIQSGKTTGQSELSDEQEAKSTVIRDKKSAQREVLLGVRELENNTKNIVDFAGGVVTNFTVTHRGRPIRLTDLLRREEELHIELKLLRGFKSGAYILTTDPAEVIIPEKTISAGVHLNVDELIAQLSELTPAYDENNCSVIVLYSSYMRQYPDFQDLQHYFHLQEQLHEANLKTNILIGSAIHDPMKPKIRGNASGAEQHPENRETNRNGVFLRIFSVTEDRKKIEQLISESEKPLSACFEKVNEKIADTSAIHQGRIKERVGLWNLGRNIIYSILDENPSEEEQAGVGTPAYSQGIAMQRIISEETTVALKDFMDFSIQLFQQNFQQETATKLTDELNSYYESINAAGEERGYISSNDLNNFIGKTSALIHDGVMIEQFVQTDAIRPVDIEIFEDGREINSIDFPITPSWEIEEMPETLGLSAAQKRRHTELLSQTLDIENCARKFGYGLREVLNPLYDILLSVNSAGEFEIDPESFAQAIQQIKLYSRDIRECIQNSPDEINNYYPKLSILVTKGKLREIVTDMVGHFEGMTLHNPKEVMELLQLIRGGKLIELEKREQNQLLKTLEAEVEERTSRRAARILKNEKLQKIHCDEVVSAIKIALRDCLETLDETAHALAETMKLDDKQFANKLKRRYGKGKKGRGKSSAMPLEDIYAERKRINISLERIIDGKTVINDLLERFGPEEDVVPQLLQKLRAQPDLPIIEWVEEEPKSPTVEEKSKEEVRAEKTVVEKAEGEVKAEEPVVEKLEEEVRLEETAREIPEEPTEVALPETVEEISSEEEITVEVQEPAIQTTISQPIPTESEEPLVTSEAIIPEVVEEQQMEEITKAEEPLPTVPSEQEVTPGEEALTEKIIEVEQLQPVVEEELESVLPEATEEVIPAYTASVAAGRSETVEEAEYTTGGSPSLVEELPIPSPSEEAVSISELAEPEEPEISLPVEEREIPEIKAEYPEEDREVVEEISTREEEAFAAAEEVVEKVEEIVPVASEEVEEIPSIEELQREFSPLSREEIVEATNAGLSVEELKDYLSLRAVAVAEEMSASEPELPPTPKTWQERINIEQYSNIREFLQIKQLKLTTTGRQLSSLKRISEDVSKQGELLIAEIIELRDNEYSEEVINSLTTYLTDELKTWESKDITEEQLPQFTRQRTLSFYVCYEQDIEEFLDIATKYEELIEPGSPLEPECKEIEKKYMTLIETI